MDIEFNAKFSGDISLIRYILRRYKDELPYNGSLARSAEANSYSLNIYREWGRNGVPRRAWNLMHKDLIMARLMGRIHDENIRTLPELKIEFQEIQHDNDLSSED